MVLRRYRPGVKVDAEGGGHVTVRGGFFAPGHVTRPAVPATRFPYARFDFALRRGVSYVAVERRLPQGRAEHSWHPLIGGASADFAVDGYVQPSASAYVFDTAHTYDALLRLVGVQLLLVMACVHIVTKPSQDAILLQWGARSRVAPGGLVLKINATPNWQAGIFPATTATAGSVASKAISTGADVPVLALVNGTTGEVYAGVAGDLGAAAVGNSAGALAAMLAAGTAPASTVSAHGFSLFAGHNSGVTTPQLALGAGTAQIRVRNLWIVRITEDLYHKLGAVFLEYARAPAASRIAALEAL